jgi:hypothetical protein
MGISDVVQPTLQAQLVELVERKAREQSNPGIEFDVRLLEGTELDLLRPVHRGGVRDSPVLVLGLIEAMPEDKYDFKPTPRRAQLALIPEHE